MTTKLPVRPVRRFGWRPDTPDQRDRRFDHAKVLRRLRQKLPARVDLRELQLHAPVFDQGNLGSCTANAIGKAYEFAQRKQGLEDYAPSRLFIYYGEREIEGSINTDAGAEIRDGLKVVNKLGAPHETLWPYLVSRFTVKPDAGRLHRRGEAPGARLCLRRGEDDRGEGGARRGLPRGRRVHRLQLVLQHRAAGSCRRRSRPSPSRADTRCS
jgi:hypothetical protein